MTGNKAGEKGAPTPKKKFLKASEAKVDKEALKVFSDNPKMAVTVISFVTSAGAIVYRLAISASGQGTQADLAAGALGIISGLFVLGLIASFSSIVLSYRMINTITSCYLDIVDEDVDNSEAESGWASIRLNQIPLADTVMFSAVGIWMIVILSSVLLI